MQARARLQLPDGSEALARPGSLVGRAWTADVRIEDGRVSEAHALCSLRADRLLLLPLRGRLRLDGRDVPRVELSPGLRVELALELELAVLELELPESMLAVRVAGGAEQILTGVTSVLAQPSPHLESGYHPGAAALLWSDGLGWRLQRPGLEQKPLRGGDVVQLGGFELAAIDLPTQTASVAETQSRAAHGPRLHLQSRYDSVTLWRDGDSTPLLIKGQQARLLAELLALGGPARWEVVAGQLWRDEEDRALLRRRLDVVMAKLRRQLDGAGVRRDLVVAHNNGHFELLLYPGDRAEDLG